MMTRDEVPSSNDDALQETGTSEIGTDGTNEVAQPWWASDPAIAAARDEVDRWLAEAEADADTEPAPAAADDFSAIHREVSTGACRTELRRAREDLARARQRYAAAVKAARAVGYSWGEIGQVLGVPRQSVHRRFRNEVE
jgi:DNA-directed RNA polymerase specialized sigma24 family protein